MSKAKELIEKIISQRAKGDTFLETSTKFKLLIKGIDVNKITNDTPDDPFLIKKIFDAAEKFNINLEGSMEYTSNIEIRII